MFGSANKVKIDPELLARIKQIAEVAGYASHEASLSALTEQMLQQVRSRR